MDLQKKNKCFQLSVKHNDIYFYLHFYLDNMFRLIDQHQDICTKLRKGYVVQIANLQIVLK
jgi:hypothetical protein